MKIFVDTADIEEIKQAIESGVVDGVTTNPSLLKKAGEKHGIPDIKKYLKEILKVAGDDRPVSVEVTETSYEGMKGEAEKIVKLFKRYKNLTVKIPVNPSENIDSPESFDSLKLIKEISSKGVSVNTTLVMSPEQALLAAKAGADYVSPFAGRIDDYIRETQVGMRKGKDFEKNDYFPAEGWMEDGDVYDDNGVTSGVDLVAQIVEIFENYGLKCKVLAASARNARQVREFALAGAHIATIPFSVLKEMTSHPKSVEGVVGFKQDTVQEYRELLQDRRRFSINLTS